MLTPQATSPFPSSQPDVVVLCPEADTARYRTPLVQTCHVALTSSPKAVIQYLSRAKPSLLIVDGDWDDAGLAVCDAAKAVRPTPSVLVTLSNPETAGQVIEKCDSILLKPFSPSLLSSRVGRLVRLRSRDLRGRSTEILDRLHVRQAKSNHLMERPVGTLIAWPDQHCPYCDHSGVILFDHSSHRRSWYACRACRKVWLAKRLEVNVGAAP